MNNGHQTALVPAESLKDKTGNTLPQAAFS